MATEAEALTQKQRRRLAEFIAPFRVEPGTKIKLDKDFDPAFKAGLKKKKEGVALLTGASQLLSEYQARLAAEDTLGRARGPPGARLSGQGRDDPPRDERRQPAGRRRPQLQGPVGRGARPRLPVALRARLPGAGRDRHLQPLALRGGARGAGPSGDPRAPEAPASRRKGDVWKRRFRAINDWERHLTENGFRIVKLFLNLSKEEQRRRLLRRIDLPDHNWKFSAADVAERELLGRLPEGVLRDAHAHEHRVGAVARDPR